MIIIVIIFCCKLYSFFFFLSQTNNQFYLEILTRIFGKRQSIHVKLYNELLNRKFIYRSSLYNNILSNLVTQLTSSMFSILSMLIFYLKELHYQYMIDNPHHRCNLVLRQDGKSVHVYIDYTCKREKKKTFKVIKFLYVHIQHAQKPNDVLY